MAYLFELLHAPKFKSHESFVLHLSACCCLRTAHVGFQNPDSRNRFQQLVLPACVTCPCEIMWPFVGVMCPSCWWPNSSDHNSNFRAHVIHVSFLNIVYLLRELLRLCSNQVYDRGHCTGAYGHILSVWYGMHVVGTSFYGRQRSRKLWKILPQYVGGHLYPSCD